MSDPMLPLTLGLLLHGSGWDEMLMVGIGLVIAYLVIKLTPRRAEPDDEPIEEEVGAEESQDRAS